MMSRLLRLFLLSALLWLPQGYSGQPVFGNLQVVALAELPPEARNTMRTIKQGGLFAFQRDGAVFNNFERILPEHQRGYYHEYTVATPGANNRGVRRIVCGPLPECYYTSDHYQTFRQIRE